MPLTLQQFRDHYPKGGQKGDLNFDDVPDVFILDLIEQYASQWSPRVFGTQYSRAIRLATAHHCEKYKRDRREGRGAVGAVTGSSSGKTSTSYAAPVIRSAFDEEWGSTNSGQRLIGILNSLVLPPRVT